MQNRAPVAAWCRMGVAAAAARGLRQALRCAAGAALRPLAMASIQLESEGAQRGVGPSGRRLHVAAAATAPAGSDCPLPDRLQLSDGSWLQRPQEPAEDECCGRGCMQCVWTTYTQQLQDYQAAVAVTRGYEAPVDPFEALERRLAEQTAQLKEADAQAY